MTPETAPQSQQPSAADLAVRRKVRRFGLIVLSVMVLAGTLFAWNTFRGLFADTRSKVRDSPVVFVARRGQAENMGRWTVESVLKGSAESRSAYKTGVILPKTFFPWPHDEAPPETLVVLTKRSLGFVGKIIPESFHPVVEGRIRTLSITLPQLSDLCARTP